MRPRHARVTYPAEFDEVRVCVRERGPRVGASAEDADAGWRRDYRGPTGRIPSARVVL